MIDIYDDRGVKLKTYTSNSKLIKLDLSMLSQGIYHLVIEQGNMLWNKKITIIR
jgi:hypothetical protein